MIYLGNDETSLHYRPMTFFLKLRYSQLELKLALGLANYLNVTVS